MSATEALLSMSAIFNLGRAEVLVVDDSSYSLRLTSQMLLGFGIKVRHSCETAEQARAVLSQRPIDLLIVDADLADGEAYALVEWLRRSGLDPNAYTPVLMVSGHTRKSMVARARDCGANFIVARPLTPSTLLERILWIARDQRSYIQGGAYAGPDRRFSDTGTLPDGVERRADRRRAADLHLPPEGDVA